jgi:hypothetical protein
MSEDKKKPKKVPSAPIRTVTRNIKGIGPLGPSENLGYGYPRTGSKPPRKK